MNPATYMCLFRTHVWDSGIEDMARRAQGCAKSGAFMVLADETRGPLPVEGFFKYSHNDDFSAFGLPGFPHDNVLWWNADYPLYKVWNQYPGFDYYIMIEYDTFLNCNLDRIVECCNETATDVVVTQLQRIAEGSHWSYPTVAELGIPTWQALIPFLILSKRAVQVMFEYRGSLSRKRQDGEMGHWPYCEAFIPTAAKAFSLKIKDAAEFVDSRLLQFRPYLSLRDRRLYNHECVAHPVLGGKRFVQAFVKEHPDGGHLTSDGSLCAELAGEDPADIAAVIGADGKPIATAMPAPDPPGTIDLARGRPALQSSRSEWSKGATAAEDASLANSGPTPPDYAFHTEHEARPWWAVDLEKTCTVHAVEVLNRVGGAFEDRFRYLAIETSLDGVEWAVQFSKTDGSRISSDPVRPAVFRFSAPVAARFLRIVKLDPGVLHLRRIRVLGTV